MRLLKLLSFLALTITFAASIENHPCRRRCLDDGPPMKCYYDFTLEWFTTMSAECGDCPFNLTDCSTPGCNSADGVPRPIISINRQVPGPPIEVCENDTIVVKVLNRLESGEGTTIHWHGLHQVETPYMDGVPMVTQCKIPSMTDFTYRFKAWPPGTHFYHGHVGTQKSDGLFGALIIRQTARNDPNWKEFDVDSSAHTLLIHDWLHEATISKFTKHLYDHGNQKPDSILVNGKGSSAKYLSKTNQTLLTPKSVFHVSKNLRYRFRVVDAGFLTCPFVMSITNHTFRVIGTDSYPTRATAPKKNLRMHAGEMYDVVLETDQPVGNYWINFKGMSECEKQKTFGQAVLRYSGAPKQEPTETLGYDDIDSGLETIDFTQYESLLPNDKTSQREADISFFIALDMDTMDMDMDHSMMGMGDGNMDMGGDMSSMGGGDMGNDKSNGMDMHDGNMDMGMDDSSLDDLENHDHGGDLDDDMDHHAPCCQMMDDDDLFIRGLNKEPDHGARKEHMNMDGDMPASTADGPSSPAATTTQPTTMKPSTMDPHAGHSGMHMGTTVDPHAGHAGMNMGTTVDPHAGHAGMNMGTTMDPHAGHAGMDMGGMDMSGDSMSMDNMTMPYGDPLMHAKVHKMYTERTGPRSHHVHHPHINMIQYRPTSSPFLTQFQDINKTALCNSSSKPAECSSDPDSMETCRCTHLLRVPLGAVVELIMYDQGVMKDYEHAMHIHGNKFSVVASEKLAKKIKATDVTSKTDFNRNLDHPVRKDVVYVPEGGYTIIRFHAYNPGFWIFHCHIQFHVDSGMGLVFQVGELSDMVKPPPKFPTCGSYDPADYLDDDDDTDVGETSNLGQIESGAASKALKRILNRRKLFK